MNVLGRPRAISFRRFCFSIIVASISTLAAIGVIGSRQEAVAHHSDITPVCPDIEWGEVGATANGGAEHYVDLLPGQNSVSVSASGDVAGQCTIIAYPTPSSTECEIITDDTPHMTSVAVKKKKTFERDRFVTIGGVGGPGQNLGSSASATGTLIGAGIYWIQSASSAADAPTGGCNELNPNTVYDVEPVYVDTHPPKQLDCPKDDNNGGNPQQVGNPCDAATGNKSQLETDYESSIKGMSIVRAYNSKISRDNGFGVGWSAPFVKRIEIGVNMIRVRRANGSSEALIDDNGAWKAGLDGTLEVSQDANGYTVTLGNGDTETYNLSGKILTENINGYTLTYSYDANGNLTQVENDFGHKLTFTFDVDDRIASITTPGSTTYQYGYDGNGNLEIVTFPDSSTRQYHYEDTSYINALTGITDENGDRYATFAYDTEGWANLTEHATTDNGSPQEKFQLTYNLFETVVTVTDPIGTQTTLNFQKKQGVNKLTKATNLADNKSLTQVFDTKGNLTSRTDEVGRKTTFTYNTDNQRLTMIEASGTSSARTTTYEYLSADEDLVTKVITPSVFSSGQREIVTGYDTDRNPTTVTINGYTPSGSAISRTTTMAYDSNSNLTSIDGPRTDLSDVTTFEYYSCITGAECGQLKKVTNPLGHITIYDTYDSHGNVTQMTDPNGLVTIYTYNNRGWLASVVETPTTGPARTTSYTYDDLGQVLTVTSPSGAILTYAYDEAHDLKSITDNFGNKIEYSYDLKGNRMEDTTKDSSGNITKTVATAYGIRNRIDTINAAGSVTDLVYNAVGDLTTDTDPNLNSMTHSYDPLGRLLSTVDALSGSTTYSYNENDELIGVLAPNGANTTYSYDDLGNQLSIVSPDTGTTTFTHDEA